jgi:DUF4097 and DUF4098 domain-containing protein YvlB
MKTLTVVLMALTLTAAAAFAVEKINKTLKASSDGEVEITNIAGSVAVTGWDREEVKVTGTLGKGTEGLDFDSSGGKVIIEVKYPDNARNVEDTDLEIWVPVKSSLEVGTVSASISVEKVKGGLDLESVSGGITVTGEPETVDAECVSGGIEIDVKTKAVHAEAVSGQIVIKGVEKKVDASSVSGSIRISGGTLESVEVEAVSGSVTFDGGLVKNGRLSASSFSGLVDLYLPGSISADFDISTFSGSIKNEFGEKASRTSKYGPGNTLNFSTGSGSARITAESFSGSVQINKK